MDRHAGAIIEGIYASTEGEADVALVNRVLDEVRAEAVADLEDRLSSMVSARDLTIRDLKARLVETEDILRSAYPVLREADRWTLVDRIDALKL